MGQSNLIVKLCISMQVRNAHGRGVCESLTQFLDRAGRSLLFGGLFLVGITLPSFIRTNFANTSTIRYHKLWMGSYAHLCTSQANLGRGRRHSAQIRTSLVHCFLNYIDLVKLVHLWQTQRKRCTYYQ